MKYATVAMIAWFVALGGVCLGQGDELVVSPVGDGLMITASLKPCDDWKTKGGSAQLRSTDTNLKLPVRVEYKVGACKAGTKILTTAEFSYKKPISAESVLTLSGITNSAGKEVKFNGKISPPKPASAPIPSNPDAAHDTAPTGEMAEASGPEASPGVESKHSEPDHTPPPFLQRIKLNWLVYTDTAVLGFLLLGISTYPLWGRRRGEQHYPVERDSVGVAQQPVDLGPVVEKARTALEKATEAKKQADYARDEGTRTLGRLETALKELTALQGLNLSALVSERKHNLQHLGRVLQDLDRGPQPAVEQSGMAQSKREEAAAPAIVNRWLEEGGRDRDYLMTMANDLGVQAQRMNHKDLNLVFQDLTTFEYPFEQDANGPWFWVAIGGSTEFWAVPADAVFFGMGRAPSLVERLFDGMQGVSQGFQFKTIYRACRLKPVSGRSGVYSVVSRGLLQLEGAADPKVSRPVTFESLVPPRPVPATSSAGVHPVGKLLARWIETTGEQQRKTQEDLRRLLSQVTALQQKIGSPSPGEEQLRRYIAALQQKMKQLENELRERRAIAPPPEKPHAVEFPAEPPLGEGVAASLLPTASPSEPDTPSAGEPARKEKTADEMPVGWQEALHRAATMFTSEPEVGEVPREELYVQRVRNLAAELQTLDSTMAASVVHLMVGQQGNTFEVHETVGGMGQAQEPVLCRSCNTTHTWQLAVGLGARSAGELFIVYPLGGFNKSKYPSGYARLLANPPATGITGIEAPARLQRVGESTATYAVSQKMQLTGDEAGY